jgi:hypothetical protein
LVRDELWGGGSALSQLSRRIIAETPFAILKHMMGLRRFLLRGLDKFHASRGVVVPACDLIHHRDRLEGVWHARRRPRGYGLSLVRRVI